MYKLSLVLALTALLFESGCGHSRKITPMETLPDPGQLTYQKMELVGFIHFGMNTFTNREWGYGDEDPALFNPTELDPVQWARTAKASGMGELILTAKHHDGFCLWPSRYTEHSIRNSPYKDGKGDIVREFVDACRAEGLRVGLYLSPWDRNHEDYGKPAYLDYYRNQLEELLTSYGEINEIWFDGANGGTGYYGGANEERRIDRESYYDWPRTFELVRKLQPGIKIFSDAGPDIRWVGNENGFAGETFWSPIDPGQLVIGASDPAYLNTGSPDGSKWMIGQCDVSVRPGWFYHPEEDSLVKKPGELLDIYFKSVGRNGVLLLNIPPDTRGLIHEEDVNALISFRDLREKTFSDNLALGKEARSGDNKRLGELTDGDPDTYSFVTVSEGPVIITVDLGDNYRFNCIVLSEPVLLGQRISSFRVLAASGEDDWRELAHATTVGYKRILNFESISSDRIRVVIDSGYNGPFLSEIALYNSSK